MPSANEKFILLQIEQAQREVAGAIWTKQSYAQRKRSLVAKIAEDTRLLEALELSHDSADRTIEDGNAQLAKLQAELHQERFGSKLDRLEALRQEVAALERQIRKAPAQP